MTYLEECTKYFAPLDKISEALDNHEGIKGFSNDELIQLVCDDKELQYDLCNQRGG